MTEEEDWRVAKVRMEGELIRMNDRLAAMERHVMTLLSAIDERTKKVEANMGRVMWTVITAVILAVLGLVVNGV